MNSFIRIIDVNATTDSAGNVNKVIVTLEYGGFTSKEYVLKVNCSNVFPTSTAVKRFNSGIVA